MFTDGIIEFEGVKVKPSKTGVYRCPFKCHRADYPAPKWKTVSGIMKHLENCPKRPSNVKRLEENKEVEQGIFDGMKQEALKLVDYKIGETIFWIKRIIVKDTHEQRGNRLVKVRYEPVLRFEPMESEIESIDFKGPNNYAPNIEYLLKNCLYFNKLIPISNVRKSFNEAKEDAKKMTEDDEKYRHEASMFR